MGSLVLGLEGETNTGDRNQLSPQFKRIAALLGDMVFAAATRFFARSRSEKQPVYVFRASHFSPSVLEFYIPFHPKQRARGSKTLKILAPLTLATSWIRSVAE